MLPNETIRLRQELTQQRQRADDAERRLAILEKKNQSSLANNLCPDHRDKQDGRPCLACLLERSERRLAEVNEKLNQVEDSYAETREDRDDCVKKLAEMTAERDAALRDLKSCRDDYDELSDETNRFVTSDDKIGSICLAAGFDHEHTADAVQAMAANLAEVVTDCNLLRSSRDEETSISDAWMKRCNEVQEELAAIKATIAAAPAGRIVGFHDGCILDVELDEGEQVVLFNRVRLLREPEVVYPSEGEVAERGVTVAEMALEPEVSDG